MLVIFSPASEAARGQEPRGKPRREKPEERAGFRALAEPERPEFVALKPHEPLTLTRENPFAFDKGTNDTEDDLHPGNYLLHVIVGISGLKT